jgi:hypothetical protein
LVGLRQREPLDALTAVVQGLVQCRAGGERVGVGVIAVLVGEQARYRARRRRDDLREPDGVRALAGPGEHGEWIRERIDHHSLSLRRDLNARPSHAI